VKLTCPRCGKPHDGADEQASGRVEAIRCACGTRIPVAAASTATGSAAGARYDVHAARNGLLIDEAEARALAARDPFVAAAMGDAPWGDFDVTMNFSTALPLPAPENKEKKAARREAADTPAGAAHPPPEAPPAPLDIPSAWIVPAAALAAFLAVGGGMALFLVPTPMLLDAVSKTSSRLLGEAPPDPPLLTSADVEPAPALAPPGEAASLEPARQTARATAPAPPHDGRVRTRTRLAARQRLAGQR